MKPIALPLRSGWPGLAAAVVLAAILGLSSLTNGHEWEGDSFGYLMQARGLIADDVPGEIALTTFSMTESSYVVGPTVYPWGYPVLLVPVLERFGLDLLALKSVSVIVFALFLACLFLWLRTRVPVSGALFVVALFALNPVFASYHDLLLSDIPFLFFSMLSVLLIDNYNSKERSPPPTVLLGVLVGTAIFAAFFTRTNGVLLLPVLLTGQLAGRRVDHVPRARFIGLLPYVTFLTLFLLASTKFPAAGTSHFEHLDGVSLKGLLYNAVYYAALPSAFFESIPLDRPLYVLTFPLVLLGVFSSERRDYSILAYCVLTYLLFVVWPWRSGIRFIFPILPFYIYFLYRGVILALDRLHARTRRRAAVLALGAASLTLITFFIVSLDGGLTNLANDRQLEGPFDPESTEMFAFVSNFAQESDVIVFFRPRIMTFKTGNRSILINDCDELPRGDYYVYHEQDDRHNQIPLDRLLRCEAVEDPNPVFANANFRIYRIDEPARSAGGG